MMIIRENFPLLLLDPLSSGILPPLALPSCMGQCLSRDLRSSAPSLVWVIVIWNGEKLGQKSASGSSWQVSIQV